jgi:hypothetical protein
VGDRVVGGSHLPVSWYQTIFQISQFRSLPDTHNINFIAFHRDADTLKDIRKAEHSLSVTRCAFRKYDHRSTGGIPNLLQRDGTTTSKYVIWWNATCVKYGGEKRYFVKSDYGSTIAKGSGSVSVGSRRRCPSARFVGDGCGCGWR